MDNLDKIICGYIIFVRFFIPAIIIPFAIYSKLDPFIYVLNTVLNLYSSETSQDSFEIPEIFYGIIRFLACFIPVFEVCRIMPNSILLLELVSRRCLAALKLINFSYKRWNVVKYRKRLLSIKMLNIIIDRYCIRFFANNSLALLVIGLTLTILANYVSIKMYDEIPMPVFLYFPVTSMECFGFILMLLPPVTNVYENANKLLEVSKLVSIHFISPREQHLCLKILKSTYNPRFCAGIGSIKIVTLKKLFIGNYLSFIIEYTVTLILTGNVLM